jgi:hypothetical protein
VKVAPTECDLKQLVQTSDAAVAAHVQTPPKWAGLHPAPPDCGAGKFRLEHVAGTIIAQDRFVGAILSPRFFSRSLSWRAGERHCDLVLDRVTRQLRAAHQRAAIKTFRWGVTVHRRVGWEREEWGIGNRRAASFGPFVLLAQEVSFGGSAASNGNRSSA